MIPPELTFDQLPAYQDIIKKLSSRNKPVHLLLGNGFSMAYDHKIFSYNALYDFIEKLEDPVLSKLFNVINTKNFEQVMRQLDNFIEIAAALDVKESVIDKLKDANEKLQNSLIDAISKLHPEHVFKIDDEKSQSCFYFLNHFVENGSIFSTNYDLLLYWVLMRNEAKKSIDGFGRELLNPKETKQGTEPEYSDLQWGKYKSKQCVHYLHGALPFFDTGIEIEKEIYTDENNLLDNIKYRLKEKDYPIFVTAGNAKEKLEHIKHNSYLDFCYEQLGKITGSLITFGFGFGEYDDHLIDAINKAAKHGAQSGEKLFSIYIGVFSDRDLEYIKSIEHKFEFKVNVYDSTTTNIWNS